MSNQAITWALGVHTGDAGSKAVLVAISNYANGDNEAFVSIKRLASDTDQSERTVKRKISTLIDLGFVTRRARGGEDGGRLSNVYTVAGGVDPEGFGANLSPGVWGHFAGGLGPNEGGFGATDGPHNPITQEPKDMPPKKRAAKTSDPEIREDVERVCDHLASLIEGNGSKRPAITAEWRTQARLLMDADKRSEAQVHNMVRWCQGDTFWRRNIMSMPKLRLQYDRMRLQAMDEATREEKLKSAEQPRAWTPPPPPAEIVDDPAACDRWYREQIALHDRQAS